MLKKTLKIGGAALAMSVVLTAGAKAGTTGTEFQAAYDLITAWLTGYLGKAIALAFFVIGIFMGVARQNLMAAGIAVAAAFAIGIVPGVLDGVLTATVTPETVAQVAK